MDQGLLEKITAVLQKEAEEEGIELVSVKFKIDQMLGKTLEVLVDKDYQITLDEITAFSEKASELLDSIEDLTDSYMLDVSSGGSEKQIPFEDLTKLVDHWIDLKLKDGKKVTAKLVALEDENARFEYFVKGKKVKFQVTKEDVVEMRMGYKA